MNEEKIHGKVSKDNKHEFLGLLAFPNQQYMVKKWLLFTVFN